MSGGDDHDDVGGEKRAHDRMPIRLIVDYEDADDFLGDYTVNLSAGGTFIHTTRMLALGT